MENKQTALLVMDMQMGILKRFSETADIIKNVAKAIEKARANNITVIFVRVGFQKGLPEVSPNNAKFAALKAQLTDDNLETYMKIHPEINLQENDIIISKKRISAFNGSDLEMILRAKNIQNLALAGVATSGVILSTLREAFDKDYQLTVLADACTDSSEEVHSFLIEKIFPTQAKVVTVEGWSFE
jgi:nicotinamidase-related amidase